MCLKIDDAKINTENYSKFLDKAIFEWYRSQPRFKLKIIFMQDNVPLHSTKITIVYFVKNVFKNGPQPLWILIQ